MSRAPEVNTGSRGMFPSEFNAARLQVVKTGQTLNPKAESQPSPAEQQGPMLPVGSEEAPSAAVEASSAPNGVPLVTVYERQLDGKPIPAAVRLREGGPEVLIPCFTMKQLDAMSPHKLKELVRKLIDECGSEDLPPISSINAHSDALVHWLLQVQCVLAQAAGMVRSTKSAEFPVSPGLHSPSPSASCSTTLATRSPYTSCVK